MSLVTELCAEVSARSVEAEHYKSLWMAANNELAKAKTERESALSALEGLIAIRNDSEGVSGYHLNGEIAHWDEFEEVALAEAIVANMRKDRE